MQLTLSGAQKMDKIKEGALFVSRKGSVGGEGVRQNNGGTVIRTHEAVKDEIKFLKKNLSLRLQLITQFS